MSIQRTNVADKGIIDAINSHAAQIDVLIAAHNTLIAKLNLDAGVTDTNYAAVATTAADLVKGTGGA